MENKININPNEKFDIYKEKFVTSYNKFLQKVSENLNMVDYHTNRLNSSIVTINNPEKLRAELEGVYNQTNKLIDVLCPLMIKDEIKYLHIFPFDKKYSEFKDDSNTFELIKDMYRNFAIATRWEAESIHHGNIQKPVELKWTNKTIDKISQDRINMTGKNNSKHALFKSTFDRRMSKINK